MVWKEIKFFLCFCKACFVCGQVRDLLLFQMGKKQNTSSWFASALYVRRSLKHLMRFYVAQTTRMKLSVPNLSWEWTSVATKVSFALGGNLMEAFLNLNDSEMFNFLLATYAKAFSCFPFPVLFKASCGLWKWLTVTKGGIKFILSLADLVLVGLFFVYFSFQFSGSGAISEERVSLGAKPEVPYIDVTRMSSVDLVERLHQGF